VSGPRGVHALRSYEDPASVALSSVWPAVLADVVGDSLGWLRRAGHVKMDLMNLNADVQRSESGPARRGHFRALIVDDDTIVTQYLQAGLGKAGWTPIVAHSGPEALDKTDCVRPDIIILDLMMPRMNGFEVCRLLRERSHVPIIVLSVRNDTADKVTALSLGADDYLTKPFALEELVARMGAVLRRTRASATLPPDSNRILADVSLDTATLSLVVAGRSTRLTATECAMMTEFMDNPGKVLSHAFLLSRVWGSNASCHKEYVHVFVNRLRSKIETDPARPVIIRTVRGMGYVFRPPDGKKD